MISLFIAALVATTPADVPSLKFDFPAVQIGIAEYEEGPTGATVFYFPKSVTAAVDVRGGSPATINTDSLRFAYDTPFVDAITFAGGSSYGLSVATGVAEEIKARSANAGDWGNIATVAGAIIFDLGGRRYNTLVPDGNLGRAALRAARTGEFPLGAHGAGRFAMQGGYYGDSNREHSGQGAAFRQVGNVKVAVFTVVNALGAIVDRSGNIVRCAAPPCGAIANRLRNSIDQMSRAPSKQSMKDDAHPTEATTLTLVLTNQKLPFWAVQRLAIQVHTSMSRAIQPFHTTNDGDVLFAATTGEVDSDVRLADLGVVAAELAWDAILSSVPQLDAVDDRRSVALSDAQLDAVTGTYEFAPGATAAIARSGSALRINVSKTSIYLTKDQPAEIEALSPTEFRIKNARRDRLRFERDPNGRIIGLTMNPGGWPIRATRTR